ncbi:MAG: MoaD/ThiS family protein [Desulfovibrio sp.]|jgi:molybdopterin converting factor small subunit|nr:MoaD/ThiS family protein [Desulfovibrio sp.]
MAVTILIPTALRAFTGRQSQAQADGKTVGEVLKAFADANPDVRQHLYDENGELRSFVNVYIGDVNIRNAGGLGGPIEDGDTLTLVPAIAGGVVCEPEQKP